MNKEKKLLKRLRKKEEEAYEELIEDYGGLIYKVLNGYFNDKNKIDDLFQDIFIKIYKNIDSFREESKLSVWIYRIAMNRVKNYFRLKYNRDFYELDDDYKIEFKHDLGENVGKEDIRNLLDTYIDQLPPNWQTVINLYYFNSFSYKEISKITGFPMGTIKTYLYRAKKKLSGLLEKHEKELLWKKILMTKIIKILLMNII